jgi:hypothetical protein
MADQWGFQGSQAFTFRDVLIFCEKIAKNQFQFVKSVFVDFLQIKPFRVHIINVAIADILNHQKTFSNQNFSILSEYYNTKKTLEFDIVFFFQAYTRQSRTYKKTKANL